MTYSIVYPYYRRGARYGAVKFWCLNEEHETRFNDDKKPEDM